MARDYYNRRKEAGLCTNCGLGAPAEGKLNCKACREVLNVKGREQRLKHAEKIRAYFKTSWNKIRTEAIMAYGGKCVECGNEEISLLELDHVYNDGQEDRMKHGGYTQWMKTLKKRGYPNNLQVLCSNCHSKKKAKEADKNLAQTKKNKSIKNSERTKRIYWYYKNLGICWKCKVTRSLEGGSMCQKCLDTSREAKEKRKAKSRVIITKNQKRLTPYREAAIGYGGRCFCPGCTIEDLDCLELHHINGGGRLEIESKGGWRRYFKDLKDGGYPKDAGLQVLCANCHTNITKGITCKH